MEDFCETMTKKHAMECAKLMKEMKEYEEVKERDLESKNEMRKEAEGKDQGWKNKIEEIPTLVKEVSKKSGREGRRQKSRKWTTTK